MNTTNNEQQRTERMVQEMRQRLAADEALRPVLEENDPSSDKVGGTTHQEDGTSPSLVLTASKDDSLDTMDHNDDLESQQVLRDGKLQEDEEDPRHQKSYFVRNRWWLLALCVLLVAVVGISAALVATVVTNKDDSSSASSKTSSTEYFTTDGEVLSGTLPFTPTPAPATTNAPVSAAQPTSTSAVPPPTTDTTAAVPPPTTIDSTTTTTAITDDEAQDVIIIGAGWAGIAAMEALLEQGVPKVRILEARDYVGGRSRTDRAFVPGLPVEEGSEWVYEETALQDLLDDLGLPYGLTEYDSSGYYESPALLRTNPNNNLQGGSQSRLSNERAETLLDRVWKGDEGFIEFAAEEAKSLGGNMDEDFVQIMQDYWAAHPEATEEDMQLLRTVTHSEIETEYASPLSEASVREIAPWMMDMVGYTMNYLGVPDAGYDSLVSSVAAPFLQYIQLQSRVTSVSYSAGGGDGLGVQVTYTDLQSGATRRVAASSVLVTLPLGVLKAGDVEFVPPLPQAKVQAIQGLGYGTLNKIILYWQDSANIDTWWPDDSEQWLSLTTAVDEDPGPFTNFFNPSSQNGGARILVGWTAGDKAQDMVTLTDAEILESVLANLRTMLGPSVPAPFKSKVVRWNQDEFSRGSYSFPSAMAAGNDASFREELGRPVGNLFWAGEACDGEWYATTAGAYDSGARAAEDIASALN